MIEGFHLTGRVCSPLISKQTTTNTVRQFLTAFITLKACLHHPAVSFHLFSRCQDWCYYLIKGGGVCSSGGKRKRDQERGGGRGCMDSFDWLAADGALGVFIPRRRLISGACKSTWQVFTGAVNPTDSIHFANCSDAASLRREDQTFAPFSVCQFVLSSWWKAESTLSNVEMKGVAQPPWQSDYSSKRVCGFLYAAHWVWLFLNSYLQWTDLLWLYAVIQLCPASRSHLFAPRRWPPCAPQL